jgi:hypothetical protein
MRFRLRTLLIVLLLAPPVLAGVWLRYRRYADEMRGLRHSGGARRLVVERTGTFLIPDDNAASTLNRP